MKPSEIAERLDELACQAVDGRVSVARNRLVYTARSLREMDAALKEAQELLSELARPKESSSVFNVWTRCVAAELKIRRALGDA